MTTGARILPAIALFSFILPASAASKVLFPAPLHITREVVSPVSKTRSVVEEYCSGNRVVSVSGSRTAIVDYDRNEMTAIDFAAGTYSITKFEEIAKANQGIGGGMNAVALAGDAREWKIEPRGGSVVASRPGETIEAERKVNHLRQSIRVTADQQLALSRGAVEALLGSSYPNAPDAAARVVLDALRKDADYRLPLEHIVRFDLDGEIVESRSVVLRVGSELAPPDVLAIPPGAKLVETGAVAARKQLDELEHPTSSRH